MKAQVSLELLFVLAAFLAVLAILIPLEEGIRDKAVLLAENSAARAELAQLGHATDSVYLLGNGNTREIKTPHLSGKNLVVSSNKLSIPEIGIAFEGKFQVEQSELTLGNTTITKCENLMVSISSPG